MKTTFSGALDIILGIPPIDISGKVMDAKTAAIKLNLSKQKTMDNPQS